MRTGVLSAPSASLRHDGHYYGTAITMLLKAATDSRDSMDFCMDESGNTEDLARTRADLDFGGQVVFSLAAVAIVNKSSFPEEFVVFEISFE